MELEEAKKYIIMILRQKDVPDAVKSQECIYAVEAIETVLQALEKLQKHCKEMIKEKQELTSALLDSIPKEKIEDKIEYLENLRKKAEKQIL